MINTQPCIATYRNTYTIQVLSTDVVSADASLPYESLPECARDVMDCSTITLDRTYSIIYEPMWLRYKDRRLHVDIFGVI